MSNDDVPNVPEDLRDVWETALELEVIADNWALMREQTKRETVKRSADDLKTWFRNEKESRK